MLRLSHHVGYQKLGCTVQKEVLWMLIVVRTTGFVFLLVCFFSISIPVKLMPLKLNTKRTWLSRIATFFCRQQLKLMNVHFTGQLGTRKSPGTLHISNHLSYLDVLIYLAIKPTLFVTSLEIKNTPFLGWLTDLGACLYVDRKSKDNLSQEVSDITQALKEGFDVMIFPEATSTNGEEVLRFRRPLYQAAIDASTYVQAHSLNYKSISNRNFDINTRDIVCWYGDMPFLSHLLKVFSQTSIYAQIISHQKISTADKDTSELALETWTQVNSSYFPVAGSIHPESAAESLSLEPSL